MVINVKFCSNHGNHYICLAYRGFICPRVLVFFSLFMDSKNSLYGSLARARIGIEIIYSLPAFLVDMA